MEEENKRKKNKLMCCTTFLQIKYYESQTQGTVSTENRSSLMNSAPLIICNNLSKCRVTQSIKCRIHLGESNSIKRQRFPWK